MLEITWLKEEIPQDLKVKQVYALAFSEDGMVLLRVEDEKYSMTGGKPEETDLSMVDTVKREYIEEVNTEIEDLHYLGHLLIEEDGRKYAQARMIAKIKKIGEVKPDVDNGKIYKRFLARQDNVKKYLNYEPEGSRMIDDAIALANEKFDLPFGTDERFV